MIHKSAKGSSMDPKTISESFDAINEKRVDDINLDIFYKPHTITLLAVSIAAVIYSAFVRDESNINDNLKAGSYCIIFFFLIISILAFPNGPFIRPHPAVWRMVFGLSVLYLISLLFLLFQNYRTVKEIIFWIDPGLKSFHIDNDKEYGVNCSDITAERVWYHIYDVFALAHFTGWMLKAILIRHLGILWAISCMWEVTEIAFAHLLPNFVECWWDALILDILICNGIGIWVGLKICKTLEMREYKWVSIRDIQSTTGKIKRAFLQFTPGSWTHVRWLDPKCTYMRFFALCQLVVFWQISELNTFFLKHIFEMPPAHFLVVGRLALIGLIVAPSVRQYYTYVTNPRCKRVGTQCWVYGAIMTTEAILCIKNGKELFERTQAINIIIWLLIQFLISISCVYGCVLWHKYFQNKMENSQTANVILSGQKLLNNSSYEFVTSDDESEINSKNSLVSSTLKKRFASNQGTVMSLTSKIVLWLAGGLTTGIIGYVHFKQWLDKQKLHEGVLKDIERQQKRKTENLYFLQQQLEMSKILKKEQSLDEAVTHKLLEDSKEKTL